MSWEDLYGNSVKLPANCPQCGNTTFTIVKVVKNSFSCNRCGAWVMLRPLPEPEPHHNLD